VGLYHRRVGAEVDGTENVAEVPLAQHGKKLRLAAGPVNQGQPPPWIRGLLQACLIALLPLAPGCATSGERGPLLHPQEGFATQYTERMAGRRTASGDTYRPGALTAAHRSLPFGTKVRVSRINATGGIIAGPVIVRINDRGPFDRTMIIDLSQAAARALEMREEMARVRLEVIELPGRTGESQTGGGTQLQSGATDPEAVSNGSSLE
jgi:rare lipoprotein A